MLLRDLVMPRLNGKDLAERGQTLHPETQGLYMSGYPDDELTRHGLPVDTVEMVQKPFTRAELAEKVRNLLDRKAAATTVKPGIAA
jgi:two-component system cell cycle sensor histidine kinase/response regulator CckA